MTTTTEPQVHDDALASGYERVNLLFAEHGLPSLTAHQVDVVDGILHAMCCQETPADLGTLAGAAGTGKTTALVALVIAAALEGLWVTVAAPTHKAVSVLNDKLDFWSSRIPGCKLPKAVTIHSLLKLKPRRSSENGAESWVQSGTPQLESLDLLIIDECSMIGKDLYGFIDKSRHLFSGLLLFTGDPNQLPPVNETRLSASFDTTRWELTEVLRHDGAILNLATRVRTSRFVPQISGEDSADSTVFTHENVDALVDHWLETLAAAHKRDPASIDNIILLCWVNKHRRAFNKAARERLFGTDVPEFQSGDALVAIKPVIKGVDTIIYANNADIYVKEALLLDEFQPQAPNGRDLPYSYAAWELTTREDHTLYVVADADHSRWLKDISKLGKEISKEVETTKAELDQLVRIRQRKPHPTGVSDDEMKAARKAASDAKSRWVQEYFPLKCAFADVDFGYALTIHKSQGSTYREVYVHNDYAKSRNDGLALLYVAITRASRRLHHVHTSLKR